MKARALVSSAALAGTALLVGTPGRASAALTQSCTQQTASTPFSAYGGIAGNVQAGCYTVISGYNFFVQSILWRQDSNGAYHNEATGTTVCYPAANGSIFTCSAGATAFLQTPVSGTYHTELRVYYEATGSAVVNNVNSGYYTVK